MSTSGTSPSCYWHLLQVRPCLECFTGTYLVPWTMALLTVVGMTAEGGAETGASHPLRPMAKTVQGSEVVNQKASVFQRVAEASREKARTRMPSRNAGVHPLRLPLALHLPLVTLRAALAQATAALQAPLHLLPTLVTSAVHQALGGQLSGQACCRLHPACHHHHCLALLTYHPLPVHDVGVQRRWTGLALAVRIGAAMRPAPEMVLLLVLVLIGAMISLVGRGDQQAAAQSEGTVMSED